MTTNQGIANLLTLIRVLADLGLLRRHLEGIVFPEIDDIGSGVKV